MTSSANRESSRRNNVVGDLSAKLRILYGMLAHAFGEWRTEVWRRDLDDHHCCGGGTGSHNICGCGGVTVREVFSP